MNQELAAFHVARAKLKQILQNSTDPEFVGNGASDAVRNASLLTFWHVAKRV